MEIIKLMTHVLYFPVKYDKIHYKTGRSKRQKCNYLHFAFIYYFNYVIVDDDNARLFGNLPYF